VSPRASIEEQRARIARAAPPVLHVYKPLRERGSETDVGARLLRGRRAAVRSGRKGSGPAPYGYARDARGELVPRVGEAETVQRIFRDYLKRGGSIYVVEKALAAEGLTTRSGKRWSRTSLAWLLKNRTYAGYVSFGEICALGRHAPLVAAIAFNKVQVKLRAQDKTKGRGVT